MIGVPENPIIWLLLWLIDLYWWVIVISVVVSWLVAFGVLNTYNPLARSVLRTLDALTEPVFRPIRRILPAMGGLDLSPIVVLLLLSFIRYVILWAEIRYLYAPGATV